MEERLFLSGVLIPALCAAVAASLLQGNLSRWSGAAMATALLVSSANQQGSWAWPRAGEWTWIAVALATVALCGAAAGNDAGSRTGRGVVCAVAACLVSLLLPLPGWQDATARITLAAASALGAALLLPLGMHRGGFSSWLSCSLALAAPSVVALGCGFAKLAVTMAALSATCGLMGVVTVFFRRPMPPKLSGTLVIALACVSGSATAQAFDSLNTPAWVFVVAGAAPLGAWLGEAPPFRGRSLVSALARVVGVAAIAGLAIWAVAPRLASNGDSDAYAVRGVDAPDHLAPPLVH